MYDPVIARFLQEDTYRGELNDPLSLNLYTYTHNNPITYDDPDGHWIHIAIGAAIGAAINVGITAYLDYKDDHKFNSGWKEYAGAAVEGAITGSVAVATGGSSLLAQFAIETASGFVGSTARQYFSNGKVSLKKSATDAAFNGITFIGGHYAGKALSPVKKAIAQSKVVTKTKGLVLDGLSSKSDTILSLNKRIGESVQNVFEKINLPTQNKLAFSSAGGGGRSGIEATFDYVDESVMKNFNKVYSSETLQSTVKNIDNNISSSIKGVGEAESNLRFTQTTASPYYSAEGKFAGKTIGEVSDMLRSGELKASEVPVTYIERDGTRLIENTRSSLGLKRANIPESEWTLINKTGDPTIEAKITERLERNGLTNSGTDVLRITGEGKNASSLK